MPKFSKVEKLLSGQARTFDPPPVTEVPGRAEVEGWNRQKDEALARIEALAAHLHRAVVEGSHAGKGAPFAELPGQTQDMYRKTAAWLLDNPCAAPAFPPPGFGRE